MDRSAARLLASRLIGVLVVFGSVFCLLFLIFFSLGYGGSFVALLTSAYLFILLMFGIGTVLGQHLARLVLSILLPLQACWFVVYVMLKTPRLGQACDFSCYAGPLEVIALPVLVCLIAAWVTYPGRARASEV